MPETENFAQIVLRVRNEMVKKSAADGHVDQSEKSREEGAEPGSKYVDAPGKILQMVKSSFSAAALAADAELDADRHLNVDPSLPCSIPRCLAYHSRNCI